MEKLRKDKTVGSCVPHDRAATMVGRSPRDRRDDVVGGDHRAPRVRLGDVVSEFVQRNRNGSVAKVCSVTNSTGFIASTDYFDKEVFSKDLTTYKVVEPGMFAYNPSRINVGSVACYQGDGPVIVSPLYVVFKTDTASIDSCFLLHFLKSPTGNFEIRSKTAGSVRDTLKFSSLCDIRVNLPPLPAQREIAAELDRICAMKKNAEERVEICQQLVKSKFVEMFELDGTTRTPPLRCGVSSHHDYPVVTIGDVFHVGGPKRIHQSEWQDHGVPFLRISELSERLDGNKTKAEHYISNERYEELKAQGQVPVAGDVLVTARGTLGRCYVVGEKDEFYFQDGMITWLSQRSEKIDLSYFLNAMKSDEFRRQYEGKMPGSTVAYLSIGQLAKLKLPLPPIGEQRQFAAYVAKVEKMEAVAREMVTTAEMLYRAKLQEYFGW